MKYEFKRQDAFDFANRQGAVTRVKGNELDFTFCPYCHGGRRRDKNTFAINLDTGMYKCLRASCNAEGNFITLSRDFDFSLGNDFDEYYNRRRKFRRLPKLEKVEPKDKAVEFMESRGISESVTNKYELTVQTDNENVLVFPFRDENNDLQFVKYRNINFNGKGNKEWCEKDCKPILFGMNQCNLENKTLVITEGQIDSLTLSECGIENAVSVPNGALGFTWIPYCWDWFTGFDNLIVFGDFENGSMTLLPELKKRFKGQIKAVQEIDYKDCKDANQLLMQHGKQAVIDAVHNAKLIPVTQVKQLADVEYVDIYSLPKISTGIKSLDKLLGGLYYGQTILLSGRRGEGKSTFMSQIIAESLEQDNPVFIYSGELNDYYFKNWLDLQLAGPRNLITSRDRLGFEYQTITRSTVDKISDWYRDKAYIYDNNIIDSDEMEDLLKVIEKSIMQYGIKLVCVDNLMTALEVDARDDLYRAQSKFVGNLTKLAKRYDVVVILVAHPRKQNMALTNDDVSGSADITNRVDVVMNYTTTKDRDLSKDERILSITKNRLTGKITKEKEEIVLKYHDGSKRIYETERELNKAYSWETDKDGFVGLSEEQYADLPFM